MVYEFCCDSRFGRRHQDPLVADGMYLLFLAAKHAQKTLSGISRRAPAHSLVSQTLTHVFHSDQIPRDITLNSTKFGRHTMDQIQDLVPDLANFHRSRLARVGAETGVYIYST
ncbi:hypothetical protein RRG08_008064 [Elysia crispata]|uniref:Uncharacterized protein n=1 Tax=Elysia crispata TaxID=231223 RepID=A0AAE0Z989_9GAST|nr:hypothetical protein RRG08_008064 [Elysia crispata]